MRELFSCRNCIHNAGQSLNIGTGQGFCMKHSSILDEPADTTCKYQHRKDLPHFVVDEGRSEHASEFAAFTGMVGLSDHGYRQKVFYSERYSWEHGTFDPVNNALANYHKAGRSWVYVQSFAGAVDGRRALVHGCLSRRYLDHCGTWTSSYRLALALVQEMAAPAYFGPGQLSVNGEGAERALEEARWDLFFAQLSGLQEYGWHAGVEDLMWASDGVNGGLAELDWDLVKKDLEKIGPEWTDRIIQHARDNDAFFTHVPGEAEDP